mmetsp:Transcript_1292/g.2301  ORF Transcript_1292/g.2301 Transcript_1292/m.2301 type:complete len:110 (-) Transcript_1292:31-360(-)
MKPPFEALSRASLVSALPNFVPAKASFAKAIEIRGDFKVCFPSAVDIIQPLNNPVPGFFPEGSVPRTTLLWSSPERALRPLAGCSLVRPARALRVSASFRFASSPRARQ